MTGLPKVPFKPVNCRRCKHFYITWDKDFPQGCRLYTVKSKQLPCVAVLDATGAPCQYWEEAPRKPSSDTA